MWFSSCSLFLWSRLSLFRAKLLYFTSANVRASFFEDEEIAGQQSSSSRLVNTPSDQTYGVVGLWMLMHAGGVLLQHVSRNVMQVIAARYYGLARSSSAPESTSIKSLEEQEEDDSKVPIRRCAICHKPCDHASYAVTCGHVLCWKCWHTWLNIQSACPICRAPCRPQDILPLY
jgi:hypothetical protein